MSKEIDSTLWLAPKVPVLVRFKHHGWVVAYYQLICGVPIWFQTVSHSGLNFDEYMGHMDLSVVDYLMNGDPK